MSKQFGATSTTDDVLNGVDLAGKRILVTGVSAGLGVETARTLAAHGAQVVGTARSIDKARRALDEAGAGKFELVELDLANLASVRSAADKIAAAGKKFDLIIANAGVMATPFGKTDDGFETQFGTNHLGHFLLINRLVPLLKEGSRVVMLSSSGHRFSNVDLEDPGFDHTEYTPFGAYGRSKTANILFAVELDRRHKDKGIRATAVHPGGIQTELARHMEPGAIEKFIDDINSAAKTNGTPEFEWKSIPQGAATGIWAGLVAPSDAVGAHFCEDCHVAEITEGDELMRGGVRAYALDADTAKALWKKSEEMVGESF